MHPFRIVDFSFNTPSSATTAVPPLTGNPPEPGTLKPQNPIVVEPSFKEVMVIAGLVGGCGGTLDVWLQNSPDKGVSWLDAVHFPQIANGAALTLYRLGLTKRKSSGAITVVGGEINNGTNTPALAANTFVDGPWGDRWQVIVTTGAGTNAAIGQFLKMIFTD